MTHVVQPDRLIAGWWSVVTALLTIGAGWLVGDSGWYWPYVSLLAVSALVWGWFLVQALAPSWMSLVLDDDGMRGRFLWQSIDLEWSDVHLVRVDHLAGDAVLEVTTTGGEYRTRVLPLPIGISLPDLHDALAATLGPGPQPALPT
ncbi:MAG TPA: hypothetical protein VGA36_03865 [Nitriliruptorales bacterium]